MMFALAASAIHLYFDDDGVMRLTSVPLIHFTPDGGSMSWMAKKAGSSLAVVHISTEAAACSRLYWMHSSATRST
jgi:hypothetical protein